MIKTLCGAMVGIAVLVGAACGSPGSNQTASESAPLASYLAVPTPRVVDGVDLCSILTTEEFDAVVGRPVTRTPAAEGSSGGCQLRIGQDDLEIRPATDASGQAAPIRDHSALVDSSGGGCVVSVALLPGSTPEHGSFLQVTMTSLSSDERSRCRTAADVASEVVARLPQA